MIKILKGMAEKSKVSIRNIRREANEDLKKLKEKKISEDENKNFEKSTKLTDEHIQIIEKITIDKEKKFLNYEPANHVAFIMMEMGDGERKEIKEETSVILKALRQ